MKTSEQEAAALQALRHYVRMARAYNALIDTPGLLSTSPEYIRAANEMEAAETALLSAAAPLLDEPAG